MCVCVCMFVGVCVCGCVCVCVDFYIYIYIYIGKVCVIFHCLGELPGFSSKTRNFFKTKSNQQCVT